MVLLISSDPNSFSSLSLISSKYLCFNIWCLCLLVVSGVYITFVHTLDMLISQNGLDTKVEKSRKQLKERKNRAKKIRGVKKVSQVNCLHH